MSFFFDEPQATLLSLLRSSILLQLYKYILLLPYELKVSNRRYSLHLFFFFNDNDKFFRKQNIHGKNLTYLYKRVEIKSRLCFLSLSHFFFIDSSSLSHFFFSYSSSDSFCSNCSLTLEGCGVPIWCKYPI